MMFAKFMNTQIRILICTAVLVSGVLKAAPDVGVFTNNSDVGVTPKAGEARFDAASGEYRITGGGANVWGTADVFQFAWKKMSGDIAVTADVQFVGAGAVLHRKAMLMIRQSLDANSTYADVALHGDGLTSLQFRPSTGAVTQEVRSELKGPTRLRIERRGERLMLYAGAPGSELKPAGPAIVALQDPVYVGLAVCSHDANILETAIFSNLKVEALAPQGPPRPRYSSKISIYDLKTKTVRALYEAKEEFEAPNWSRDGKFLLVNSGGRLWRIPVAEGGAKPEALKVDPSLRCNNDHDYSHDGKRIALSATSPSSRQSQVYVADADGSNARLVTAAAPSYFHGWSPDGKYLAYVAQRDGKFSLFRVLSAGGEEERLTSKSPDDGPDYSPDGKWIYFNSQRSGDWDIWRIPAQGAGPGDARAECVTSDELADWFPHPSPDGKWMLVFSFPKGTPGHNGRMEGVQLRLFPLPGAKVKAMKPRVVTTFFGGQGSINVNSWSPDSKRFAFVIYKPLKNGANE